MLISVPNLSLFSLYCSMYLNLWHVDVEASQHLIDQDGFLQVLPCYFTLERKEFHKHSQGLGLLSNQSRQSDGPYAQSIAISREVFGEHDPPLGTRL